MSKYNIYDSLGNYLGSFGSFSGAQNFIISNNRYDWSIRLSEKTFSRKSTNKQKAAVHFCEQWLNVKFRGDINNFSQVSHFLSLYLRDTKLLYMEVKCEYEAYRDSLYD